jgi:hypothetical protein
LEFLEKATQAVDNGEAFDAIFLDFAKAFDKVPHARLLKKLKAHGIDGQLQKWIANWLVGRWQRVVWGIHRQFLERPSLERPSLERPSLERPSLERPSLERPSPERHSLEATIPRTDIP